MDRNVGLWIDHKQAYLIWNEDGKVEVIPSRIEPPAHYSGGTKLGGKQTQKADIEARRSDRFRLQINKYYQQVIRAIKDASSFFVMGPGEAKVEFQKAVQKSKDLQKRLLKVETTDKMTKNQMIAYVKKFYKKRPVQ
jgi:stalled ribosome rescue protein Dom34